MAGRLDALRHAIALPVAVALLAQSEPVHANSEVTREQAISSVSDATIPPVATSEAEVRIRVGRAIDLEGAPVYAARSAFSRIDSIATFSRSPIPARRAVSMAAFPSQSPLRATVTSGFGMRIDPILRTRRLHSGIDLAAPRGSLVVATSGGTVSMAGWNGGYGLYVALEHGAGLQTRYGHMSRLNVVAGQAVRQGDVIGYVGSTGRSTGPHLHFETRIDGQAVRPNIKRSR